MASTDSKFTLDGRGLPEAISTCGPAAPRPFTPAQCRVGGIDFEVAIFHKALPQVLGIEVHVKALQVVDLHAGTPAQREVQIMNKSKLQIQELHVMENESEPKKLQERPTVQGGFDMVCKWVDALGLTAQCMHVWTLQGSELICMRCCMPYIHTSLPGVDSNVAKSCSGVIDHKESLAVAGSIPAGRRWERGDSNPSQQMARNPGDMQTTSHNVICLDL